MTCLPYIDPRDGITYCSVTGSDEFDCEECDRWDYDKHEREE